jgi:dihydroxyacetone kinase/dihydroxyacetone kinase-like protein
MAGDLADVEFVVRTIAQTAVDNEKYFGDLDAVVGDGDFGYSMARGFEVVLADWDGIDRSDIATFLKKVAVTITGRIGGTSGPIWGTMFLRAASTVGDKSEVDADTLVAALRAATEGVKARGQAELGDKTLLDALVPATDALEEALRSGGDGAQAFATTARERADATKTLPARRGRASYTGERSIGSVDAGATAVAVMAEQIAAGWAGRH